MTSTAEAVTFVKNNSDRFSRWEIVVENLQHAMRGESLIESFDGHANCFIESGFGRALLIDFNYDVEPLPGAFPVPVIGPMALMKETRRNHWGKVMFRWVYWNMLLPGYRLPVPNRFSMRDKKLVEPTPIKPVIRSRDRPSRSAPDCSGNQASIRRFRYGSGQVRWGRLKLSQRTASM